MKSALLFATAAFLLLGCCGTIPDNLYSYKGITLAADEIPDKCRGLEDCEMFSCMVDLCWCKESQPSGGTLHKAAAPIQSGEAAAAAVAEYLQSKGSAPANMRAVRLNAIFYNVFFELEGNEERALTVGIDGTLMETVCGV